MKKYSFLNLVLAASTAALFTQCEKSPLELSGTTSEAAFSFAQQNISDTLPYPVRVAFTNSSKEEFLYQWNFGDNTLLSSEKNPLHIYKKGGTYNVSLTTVGNNGSNTTSKTVTVTDACSNDFFNKLTNCATGEWTWSTDGDAIKVLSPDAGTVYFAGAAGGCQADDVYKFASDGTLTYDAAGQTFSVQAGYSCIGPVPNATSYKVVAKTGQKPQILLGNVAGGRPFIGTTDLVDNNKYTVENYTANTMTLRSTIEGSGGVILEIKLKKVVVLTLADIKGLLTGGSSKSWKLDPSAGAKSIIVGTEGNPAEYFGGGPLDPNCQSDDVYTFSINDKITYNANGATFNGGNVAPNYNCGSDRSYNNVSYTFSATTGGVAGLATIQLPPVPPTIFIGTTDVPSENTYRIIEISSTKMVLRAGNGSGAVFQFKFIAL